MTSSGVWLLVLVPCLLTSLVCARPSSVEVARTDYRAEQELHRLPRESDAPFRSRRGAERTQSNCCFLCKNSSCRFTCTDMCAKYFRR